MSVIFNNVYRRNNISEPFARADLGFTESPEYVGRAVVAVASDANTMQKTGKVFAVGGLAAEYGFTDIDGRLVPAFKIPEEG
jgi:hypothetical protein